MNLNPKLLKLEEVTSYPVVPDLYRGDSDKYIVFTYANEKGELYADDAEQFTTVRMYVSLYAPEAHNYMTDKKRIKDALVAEGFQIEDISSYLDDSAMGGSEFIRRVLFTINFTGVENQI